MSSSFKFIFDILINQSISHLISGRQRC